MRSNVSVSEANIRIGVIFFPFILSPSKETRLNSSLSFCTIVSPHLHRICSHFYSSGSQEGHSDTTQGPRPSLQGTSRELSPTHHTKWRLLNQPTVKNSIFLWIVLSRTHSLAILFYVWVRGKRDVMAGLVSGFPSECCRNIRQKWTMYGNDLQLLNQS